MLIWNTWLLFLSKIKPQTFNGVEYVVEYVVDNVCDCVWLCKHQEFYGQVIIVDSWVRIRWREIRTWFGWRGRVDGVRTHAVWRRRRALPLCGDVAEAEESSRVAKWVAAVATEAGRVGQMGAGQAVRYVVLRQELVKVGVL